MTDREYILVVGGANIDIQGFPHVDFNFYDSNPGEIKISNGGVGRNVAENLAKMDVNVKLLTVLGDDQYGQKILKETRFSGVDMEDVLILEGEKTSSYLYILNEKGEMVAAISHMDIFDKMTPDYIKKKAHLFQNACTIVLDANLPDMAIGHIVHSFANTPIFLEPVSSTKAEKVKHNIGAFHTIKPNLIEAEMLLGKDINTQEDIQKAGEIFINKGVEQVFISLGEKGIFYRNRDISGNLQLPKVKVVNTTGSGDAFLAGLVYGFLKGMSIHETARFSLAASALTLSHEDAINPNISVENIKLQLSKI